MRLVFELQQPFLHTSIHVHIDEDRASVVFFAHLEVIQETSFLQVTGSDSSQLHETERFILAAKFHPDAMEGLQLLVYVVLDERVLHLYILQDGGESGVAAVVRPIGVQYSQFGLCGFAVLFLEIIDYASEVVCIHGESPLFAERWVLCRRHGGEAVQ